MAWRITAHEPMSVGEITDQPWLDFHIVSGSGLMAEGVLDEACVRGDRGSDDSLAGILLYVRQWWPQASLHIRSADLARIGHSFINATWTPMTVIVPTDRLFGIAAST